MNNPEQIIHVFGESQEMSFNDYETVAAYADLFDVSKHTIYKWIEKTENYKPSKRTVISPTRFNKILK